MIGLGLHGTDDAPRAAFVWGELNIGEAHTQLSPLAPQATQATAVALSASGVEYRVGVLVHVLVADDSHVGDREHEGHDDGRVTTKSAPSTRHPRPEQLVRGAKLGSVGVPPSSAHVCSPAIVHRPCTRAAAECARPSHRASTRVPQGNCLHALPTRASSRHAPRVGCAPQSHQHRRVR